MPKTNHSLEQTNNDKEEFARLRSELIKEIGLQPKERNQDHRGLTLNYFEKHGLSQEDHDLWRESKMPEDMLNILDRRFNTLNPHILRMKTMERETDWDKLYAYMEESDDTGKTMAAIDAEREVLYPAIDRKSLEMLSAQRFMKEIYNIDKARQEITPGSRNISTSKADRNNNPLLTYKQLQADWKNKHAHYTQEAIQKAIERSIEENIHKERFPWLIKGCGSDYEIAHAEIRKGKEYPTPASCFYKRVMRDERN